MLHVPGQRRSSIPEKICQTNVRNAFSQYTMQRFYPNFPNGAAPGPEEIFPPSAFRLTAPFVIFHINLHLPTISIARSDWFLVSLSWIIAGFRGGVVRGVVVDLVHRLQVESFKRTRAKGQLAYRRENSWSRQTGRSRTVGVTTNSRSALPQ